MSTSHLATTAEETVAVSETQKQIRIARLGQDGALVRHPSSAADETESRKHPTAAINGRGQFIAVWAEGTNWNKGGSAALQFFDRLGGPQPCHVGHAHGLPAWSIPAACVGPDDTFVI